MHNEEHCMKDSPSPERGSRIIRLQSTISQINQAVIRSHGREELFQKICDIAINIAKFELAWVGIIDNKAQSIVPVAFSGDGTNPSQGNITLETNHSIAEGPIGRVIREGRAIVFNALKSNAEMSPWHEKALNIRYRSAGFFPIRLHNSIVGTFNVYAVTPLLLDAEESNLFEETVINISYALERFTNKENQDHVARLSRLRSTLLAVHRQLTTISDTQLLLEAICNIFVREQGYRSSWIVLLDTELNCTAAASSGLGNTFIVLEKDIENGKIPPCIKEVFNTRKLIWQKDRLDFCTGCPLVESYDDTGVMAAPLQHEEHFYGVITVSLPENMVSDHEEQAFLEDMAGDISFALFNRKQDNQRRLHEEEISIRDQISQAFIIHQENDLYGKVLDIVLKAMESNLGIFGYLEGADELICPSLTTRVWEQCRVEGKSISFPRKQWLELWKKPLESGTTKCVNTPFKVPRGHLSIENSMVTGIVFGKQVIGLLQVANKEKGYNEQDRKLLENIAAVIAPILAARLGRKRAEDRYRTVVQDLPLLICRSTLDGRILFVNNTYGTYFGVDPAKLAGKNSLQFIPAEERQRARKNLSELGPDKPFMTHDYQVVRGDGKVRTIRWNNRLVDERGEHIIQGWGEDITDRRQMENQLLQSEKMATIAGLAAGIAHEVNTPLSGILQSVQLIEMGLDPLLSKNRAAAAEYGVDLSKVQAYLQGKELDFFLGGIRESATHAAQIIADLSQFSRPQVNEPVLTNLPDLIDHAVELAKTDYTLKRKYNILNIEFIREYSPALPDVVCVPTDIEQVLINLIKNSCQAMATGTYSSGPVIILRAEQHNNMATIEVEDNGPGMELDVSRHVFEPFFTTKDVGEGTGLGLSVSYSIICDKHGGTLDVLSSPDHGSTFSLSLPIKEIGHHDQRSS